MTLTEGSCDLLIAYHHPSQPLQLAPNGYEMLNLGRETLAPYAKPRPDGQPMHRLPTPRGTRAAFLGYGAGAYLGRLVEIIVKHAPQAPTLDLVYQTDMAEGLKAMALEGHGLAFLPGSSVKKGLKARRLVRAAPDGAFELEMEVRIYRERVDVARRAKPGAQGLWEFLRER